MRVDGEDRGHGLRVAVISSQVQRTVAMIIPEIEIKNLLVILRAFGCSISYSVRKYTEKDWTWLKVRHYPLQELFFCAQLLFIYFCTNIVSMCVLYLPSY